MACRKCQGLKPGEKLVKLGEIEVVSVRREPLSAMMGDPIYGKSEAIREGFPGMSGAKFVAMFCRHMRVFYYTPITRIEFKRILP